MKTKYYLDKDTLTYKPLEKKPKAILKNYLSWFLILMVFSVPVFTLLTTYRLTPHEWILVKQNKNLSDKIIRQETKVLELRDVLDEIEENDDVIYRTFAEIKPLPEDIRNAGFGGTDRYREFAGMEYSTAISYVIRKFDKLEKQIDVQRKSFDDIEPLIVYFDEYYASKPAIRPMAKKDELYISSYYGRRFHPVYKRWKMHHGIDYAARIGTPVYSTGKGVVRSAHYASGYGRVVKVDHDFGYMSIYAHLNKYVVARGDTVQRGQLVGYVGNTGVSTGPHLHYEIRENNRTRNPLYFYIDDLKDEEYLQIVSR